MWSLVQDRNTCSEDWTFLFISQSMDLHPSNASVVTQTVLVIGWPRSKAKHAAVTSCSIKMT